MGKTMKKEGKKCKNMWLNILIYLLILVEVIGGIVSISFGFAYLDDRFMLIGGVVIISSAIVFR